MLTALFARPITILAIVLSSAAPMQALADGPALAAPTASTAAERLVESSPSAQPAQPELPELPPVEDSFWEISTRRISMGAACHCGPYNYCVRRYDCECGWSSAPIEELLATSDPRVTTVIWVHGNQYESNEARKEAIKVWQRLRQCGDGQPMRFISWSWPSDKVRVRLRLDAEVKAERTDAEAMFLAAFVDALPPEAPVSFVGYSFGSRIIAGSLHLLAGGRLAGRSLCPPSNPSRLPMRAVLAAGAVGNTTLLPGASHGQAISQLEQVTVLFNPRDRVLRFYRVLSQSRSSDALGYTGLAGSGRLGDDRSKLDQVNVSCYVGKSHAWEAYLSSNSIMRRVAIDAFGPAIVVDALPLVQDHNAIEATATLASGG